MNLRERTVLMFSGGRDSTIAAVRLAQDNSPLTLVTVVAPHLFGIDRVRSRLLELKHLIPGDTLWICVRQPVNTDGFQGKFENTCLPCQRDYIQVGLKILDDKNAQTLALGYASYQSDWPEQHPSAIKILKSLMEENGLNLRLPVYDLESKRDAIESLSSLNMASEALEQKCIRQITNRRLNNQELQEHLSNWEVRLRENARAVHDLELDIVSSITLAELEEAK